MRIRRKKTFVQQAAEYVEAAVDAAVEKAGPILADAKDQVGAAIADVREQAGPMLADAVAETRAKAGPALADARDRATPLLVSGAQLAAEKASAAADLAAQKAAQGKELAQAKASELSGKPPKKHRLRKLMLLGGIAAALGFVVKKLQSRGGQDDWQSVHNPPPPPRSTQTPIADAAQASARAKSGAVTSDEAADEGGAGPDEALADAVEETHPVTTPDEPADVVDLEPGQEPLAKPPSRP